VQALETAGSREATREEGSRLVHSADQLLESFELPDARRGELSAIGRYLLDRDR
jgi:hypothetical protein